MYTDQQPRTMTRGELEDLRRRTLSELVRRDRGIYDLLGLKIMANQYKKDTIRLEVEFDITPGVIRYSREVEEYIMKAATPGRDVPVLSTKEELLKRAAVCQNKSKKDFSATSKRDAREFLRYARSLGLPATLRPSRGQLAAKDLRGASRRLAPFVSS